MFCLDLATLLIHQEVNRSQSSKVRDLKELLLQTVANVRLILKTQSFAYLQKKTYVMISGYGKRVHPPL